MTSETSRNPTLVAAAIKATVALAQTLDELKEYVNGNAKALQFVKDETPTLYGEIIAVLRDRKQELGGKINQQPAGAQPMGKYKSDQSNVFSNRFKTADKHPDFKGEIELSIETIKALADAHKSGGTPGLNIAIWEREGKDGGNGYLFVKIEGTDLSKNQYWVKRNT